MAAVGKRVVDDLYVHLSALEHLGSVDQRLRIEEALQHLTEAQRIGLNVAKLNLRSGRLSLLAYQDFDEDPFPELVASWTFATNLASPTFRHYGASINSPILHRKELLVAPDYDKRAHWVRVTETAESLGLFNDTTTIGFKVNWERLIAEKGYRLDGGEFVPLGNELGSAKPGEDGQSDGLIRRHLTALARCSLSAPVQLLFRNGLLPPGVTIFDYGCGRGDDVAGLSSSGYVARGWDPHFAPNHPVIESDVVNLGFVVNVIEDPAERVDALVRAFKLARQVMSIGVMLHGSEPAGRPFRDGFITSRNTFQKYFTQGELKDYVEHALQQEAFLVGPGVAIVFADKDLEQRYSAGRFRTRGVATRLLATRIPRRRPVRELEHRISREPKPFKPSRLEAVLARVRPELDSLWKATLELGRVPEPDEIANLDALVAELGSLGKAVGLLERHYDQGLLAAAANTRSDDVRLYLAVQQFSRRPTYRQLESRMQRDIKAFFGDYRRAQTSGMQLLVDAADPAKLLTACQHAAANGLGWLDAEHSLKLHLSLVERLPVLLRAYVACGLILWDAISEVQLVKIHIGSGKLTFMEFDDFDGTPVPALRRRIKVSVKRQDYDLFEYGSREHPKPLLYRKSRYLHEDCPGYAEQLAFDEALEAADVLGESEFGPTSEKFAELLEAKRLGISGLRLARSNHVPDIDQSCGAYFTFRSLVECGETQSRLSLSNVPTSPDTYNALYDLATKVLDPVIEYFGGIKLTYGFCSPELGRHISKRVAPKLDQHASHEVNRAGKRICERDGAACDFLVEHEDMREVAGWVIANTPFDRLYFYGPDRPIHVSYSASGSRQAYDLVASANGRLVPRRLSD